MSFEEMVNKAVEFENGNLIPYYLHQVNSKIAIYNLENKDDFCVWLNRFEYVASSIRVPDDKMVEFFMKLVDDRIHTIVQDNFKNVNFSNLSYEDRIDYYLYNFSQSKEDNSFRKRFKYRKQYEDESTKTYAYNLHKIYKLCNYTSNFEEILCEQFVNGVRCDKLKEYLRQLPKLSLSYLVFKAVIVENDIEIHEYLDEVISRIHIYKDRKNEEFCEWLNKFENVANTLGVPKDKMVHLFNKMVDGGIHSIVAEKFNNVNLLQLSYEEKIIYYVKFLSFKRGMNP